MLPGKAVSETSADVHSNGSAEEQTRLEDAMRRADELLVTSLKFDERRRSRRRIIVLSIGVLAMLGIVCAVLFGLTADTDKAAKLADEGWNHWKSQQFDAAIESFNEAVKLDAKNVNALNGLGWAQFNSGKLDEAEAAFKKTLALEPKFPAALNGLGQLYLNQKKYDLALKYLQEAAPQAPAAWFGLARLFLLQGKYDDAEKWAKKIVDSGEADEVAKQMLKAAQEKNLSDALRRQIEPAEMNAGAADLAKAWQLMNSGRRPEAKEIFEALLKKSPEDANVLNGMGWFYLRGGDRKQAKSMFEKAIKNDAQAAGSYNGLAVVLKADGDVDGAIKLWQQMLEKFPGPNAGTFGLADAFMEKGEFQKAVPLWEQLAKADPTDQQIKDKLARAKEVAK